MRAHLSPYFSEVSRPLRMLQADVQQMRAEGIKTPFKPKGREPHGLREGQEIPQWWTAECEQSWLTLKAMVAYACRITVPDLKGALDGTNPFRIYADACSYSIGAGVFQRAIGSLAHGERVASAAVAVEQIPRTIRWTPEEFGQVVHGPSGSGSGRTLYQLLRVGPEATKLGLDRAYRSRWQELTVAQEYAERHHLEEAYRVLGDPTMRKGYDSQMGLANRAVDRLVMVPLLFFSRALTSTEVNWTVWEKELKAHLEVQRTYAGLLAGMSCDLYTDHLNNVTLGDSLKQPAKVLRMLVEIESRCIPRWQFLPGAANPVADGFSRNCENRDEARGAFERREGLPRTLREAFQEILVRRGIPVGEVQQLLSPPEVQDAAAMQT
ncbi:MAG: hypothetical protein VYC68_02690, partial [Candidatus Thermoplasmatota archaeon]|nr:hypothetical protein [Candidatus Thermoplasmatota archaeon]